MKIIKSIYELVTHKKDIDFQDAYYHMIQVNMSKISDNQVRDFFVFLMNRQSSFTQDGFFKKNTLKQAIDDFMEELYASLWKTHELDAKSALLWDKLYAVYLHQKIHTLRQNELIELLESLTLERYTQIESGNKKPLFNDEELLIIDQVGIEHLFNLMSRVGKSEGVDEVLNNYKTFYTEKYFKEKSKKQPNLTIALPEPLRI